MYLCHLVIIVWLLFELWLHGLCFVDCDLVVWYAIALGLWVVVLDCDCLVWALVLFRLDSVVFLGLCVGCGVSLCCCVWVSATLTVFGSLDCLVLIVLDLSWFWFYVACGG